MKVAIVGGGPAGLAAADAVSASGAEVAVFDQMPSLGRKFLMAGKSGLNITHTEEPERFLARYDEDRLRTIVAGFGGAERVRAYMAELGIEEHLGSTGRVFPSAMKSSPLLRAWLARLGDRGVTFHTRHRLAVWSETGLTFQTPAGEKRVEADRIIFAAGGGSWRRLGSDGAWTEAFTARGIALRPFQPSNGGFLVPWSEHLLERFEGAPVKNIRLTAPGGETTRGEFVLTRRGIESGGVYALSAPLVGALADGPVTLTLDLLPGKSDMQIAERLRGQNPKQSLSNRLRKGLRLTGVKAALVREGASKEELATPEALADRIKAVPITITAPAPIDEAISTRGGVPWGELTDDLMLEKCPGTYCAGEMIDWDAPTGGYLLTACLATGWKAGEAARLD